jgi:hypothetical protein
MFPSHSKLGRKTGFPLGMAGWFSFRTLAACTAALLLVSYFSGAPHRFWDSAIWALNSWSGAGLGRGEGVAAVDLQDRSKRNPSWRAYHEQLVQEVQQADAGKVWIRRLWTNLNIQVHARDVRLDMRACPRVRQGTRPPCPCSL